MFTRIHGSTRRLRFVRVHFVLMASLITGLLIDARETWADERAPVAVRHWSNGVVSIESYWGLKVAVSPEKAEPSEINTDLPTNVDVVVHPDQSYDHWLFRRVNSNQPEWHSETPETSAKSHAIHVRSLQDENENTIGLELTTDGLRVIRLDESWIREPPGGDLESADVLVVPHGQSALSNPSLLSWVEAFRPGTVVLTGSWQTGTSDSKTLINDTPVKRTHHNTIALSSRSDSGVDHPTYVSLSQTPWQMPMELSRLFGAMEDSCRRSQTTFQNLSADQLNFRPANGTHTPRWNVEHMAGRQLQFFSQIYHAIDNTIPVMNENPAQMPNDYVAAHADWNGIEETNRMQRVSDFCRRFAYLLDDQDVNQRAPGSRWPSLRALLVQMERHYDEHTANTIKKFDLPDWPGDKPTESKQ
ncbi:MAG: DinB family protein [Planctomycetota bacterium]